MSIIDFEHGFYSNNIKQRFFFGSSKSAAQMGCRTVFDHNVIRIKTIQELLMVINL